MTTPADLPEPNNAPFICWGLSSFCAETGHKCRAAGTCVYAPPMSEGDIAIWGAPDGEYADKIVRRAHSDENMRAFYAAGIRAGMERAAVICEDVARNDDTCQGDLPNLRKFAAAIRDAKHTKEQP